MDTLIKATNLTLRFFPKPLQETILSELTMGQGLGGELFQRQVLARMKMRGFTNPAKAPPQLIVSTLKKKLDREPILAKEIIVAWLASELERCHEIGEYIDEKYGDEGKEAYVKRLGSSDEEGMLACNELLGHYRDHLGRDLSEQEILQFIGVVFFRPFLPDPDLEQILKAEEETASAILTSPAIDLQTLSSDLTGDSIIQALADLDAENSLWDSIPQLLERIESLGKEKLAVRVNWPLFDQLLAELERRASALRYFSFSCTDLGRDTLIDGNVAAFSHLGSEVISALDDHSKLLTITPQNVQQRRDIEERMGILENKILESLQQLSALFTSSVNIREEVPGSELARVEDALLAQVDTEPLPPEPEGEAELNEALDMASEQESESKHESASELAEKMESELEEPRSERKPEPQSDQLEPEPAADESRVEEPLSDKANVWTTLQRDPFGFYWQAETQDQLGQPRLLRSSVLYSFLTAEAILLRKLDKQHLDTCLEVIPTDDPLEKQLSWVVGAAASLTGTYGASLPWLPHFGFCTALDEFTEALREFDCHQVEWKVSSERKTEQEKYTTLARLQEQARTAVKQAPSQRISFARASFVYRTIMSPSGELGQALNQIGQSSYRKLEPIKECVRQWGTRERIQRNVLELDARERRRNEKGIVGHPLSQIVRMLEEHVAILKEWLEIVSAESQGKHDFVDEQCVRLRARAEELLPEAIGQIERLLGETAEPRFKAGLSLLRQGVCNVLYFLGIENTPTKTPSDSPSLDWWYGGIETISDATRRRLLWHPELQLKDDGTPLALEQLVGLCWREPQVPWMLKEGVKEWVEQGDFRFIPLLLQLDLARGSEEGLAEWVEEQEKTARLTLSNHKNETEATIQKALVAGMLTDVVHARQERVLLDMNPASIRNFVEARKQLEAIRREISQQTDAHIEQLRREWAEKGPSLVAGLSSEDAHTYQLAMEDALKQKDVRLARELIESKADYLKTREQSGSAEYYMQYLSFRSELERRRVATKPLVHLGMDAIKAKRTWAGIAYGHLPVTHCNQAVEALQAWNDLYNRRPGGRGKNNSDTRINRGLRTIFSFLGFAGVNERDIESELMTTGGHWLHFRTRMSSGVNARPFPQFGSLTNDCYDIICVWERPGADSLGGFIHDARLEAESTIILFFGRLSDRLHRDIMHMSRKRRLEVAVLDESLLIYLTGFPDARIPAFLKAALPSSPIIPYTPNLRGDVPNEIFYGREDLVKDLQRADGPCLVYGGRQMGKSALLKQVQRRFHDPKRRQYAWVEEIQLLGDALTGSSPAELWGRIWTAFDRMDLTSGKGRPDSVENTIDWIDCLFHENRDLRVLLLLDEADAFLNRDSQQGFVVVSQLRKLMVDHQRRFRVVFTGLHNVQRFQSLPNQPLAHFGTPIRVGPLEPTAAMNLVREPLEALGFMLDDACVLRILSFTNYHPGLIQTYCYRLLEKLYDQPKLMAGRRNGPIVIDRQIIEAVYLTSEVRREIKERFELTLSLDPRYHGIALYLVIYNRDPATSAFQPANVHAILQGLREWWPQAFQDMPSDEFRGLMIELENLGVVVEDHDGAYQLRSPNLVSLMGTDKEIQERFSDLIEQDRPDPQDNPDSYHALIDTEKQLYSPLTFQQERSLNDTFDFRIITCSQALGLGNMELAIKKIAQGFSVGLDTTKRVPANIRDAEGMTRFLKKSIDQTKKKEWQRLVVYQILQAPGKISLDGIKAAWNWFSQYTSKEKPLKLSLLFVMDPHALCQATLLDGEFVSQLDDLGLILHTRTWDVRGIDQRLRQFEKNSIEQVKQSLLHHSGGWPILLDTIMSRSRTDFDPTKSAEACWRELTEDPAKREKFLEATGIRPDASHKRVLNKLASEDLPVDLVHPEILDLDDLNQEQFRLILDFYKAFDVVKEKRGSYHLDPLVKGLLSHVEL